MRTMNDRIPRSPCRFWQRKCGTKRAVTEADEEGQTPEIPLYLER